MSRGNLTEVEWRILKGLLPIDRKNRGRGRPPEQNRSLINGTLWRLRCGAVRRGATCHPKRGVLAPASVPASVIRHGRLTLDTEAWEARVDDAAVATTATEFQLLALLASLPSKVFSRDAIIDRLRGPGFAMTDRTVDSHVRNLRAKFARAGLDDLVETRSGVGYRVGRCG